MDTHTMPLSYDDLSTLVGDLLQKIPHCQNQDSARQIVEEIKSKCIKWYKKEMPHPYNEKEDTACRLSIHTENATSLFYLLFNQLLPSVPLNYFLTLDNNIHSQNRSLEKAIKDATQNAGKLKLKNKTTVSRYYGIPKDKIRFNNK